MDNGVSAGKADTLAVLKWRIYMHTFAKMREEVSLENLMETSRQLAKWERLAGSEPEREAFRYLEGRLQEYGYSTRFLLCDALISLPVSCRLTVGGREIHAQTHSMVPSGQIKAEMVYCPNKDSICQTDCAGKIVLTRGRAVFAPVQAAQEAQAMGIVFIQEAVIRECIPSACWGNPTSADKELFPHIPVASILDEDGNVLAAQLADGAVLTAALSTKTDTSWKKIPLLLGEIQAPCKTERFVQFSGHVDSWYYGAVDNGTSNALQLEVARIASLYQKELKRNFRIVYFSGHSQGRYAGSAWYADHFWEDLYENCVVNINTDSAGCKGAEELTRSIMMPETKDLAVEIIREQTGVIFQGMRCSRIADQSFWNIGISSAFASFSRQKKSQLPNGTMGYLRGVAELGAGWHTPNDTVDCIDPDNLLRDTKILGEYVLTFLTESVLPLHLKKTAEDIWEQLKLWADRAGNAFDLSEPVILAEQLVEVCGQFDQAVLPDNVRNENILKLGRLLVPLDFTRGNPYGTEPAMSIDPLPSLTPIRRLVASNASFQDQMEAQVELVRAVNYVKHTLKKAMALLRQVLPESDRR